MELKIECYTVNRDFSTEILHPCSQQQMSIPELLCYQKLCTLLALSLIRHCSGLSSALNMKILSENTTEALSNTRGIMIHI